MQHNGGPLTQFAPRRFPRTGSDTMFRTRCGVPVHDVCSKRRFETPPDTSLLAARPRIDAAIRGDGKHVVDALATERVQTRFVRSPTNTRSGRVGASHLFFCLCFRANDIHPESTSYVFLKSIGSAFYESVLWLATIKPFRKRVSNCSSRVVGIEISI